MVQSSPAPLARAGVDRAAHRRTDDEWLAAEWASARAHVVIVDDGTTLVDGEHLVLVRSDEAPEGERYLLGADGDRTYFAVAGALPKRLDAMPRGLRDVGALLSDRDAGLFTHAVALANWHATHPRCARCGNPTDVASAGHVRRCPVCGAEHFPRTDPAVIMLVHDGAGRCVLGRQPSWPPRRFSTLAGFVEPGESAEAAVVREVREEVGVDVREVQYRGSQPWPFPASLMLGFRALATYAPVNLDGAELAEAHWFERSELRAAVASKDVLLPPPVSTAHHLINDWLRED